MKSPKVTVSIPTCCNRARFLGEAVESVLAQTREDIEVFVSNNGSTDESASLVASFDDPRLQYLILPQPGSMYANLNRCLHLGTAPFVAICQDDDFWLPNNLEKLVEMMDLYPDAVLAHAAYRHVDPDGHVLMERNAPRGLTSDTVESGEVFIRRSMASVNRVNMSSALIRRTALADDRFRKEDDISCDTGLWLRLARRGDVAFVAQPLTALRVHPHSVAVIEGSSVPETRSATLHAVRLAQLVKERFLAEFGYQGKELHELRMLARRWAQHELLNMVVRNTSPARSPVATFKGLRDAVQIEPSLLGRLRTWRVFLASLVGSRGRRVARRLLRHPRPAAFG